MLSPAVSQTRVFQRVPKEKDRSAIFKLSNPLLDEFYSFDTLFRLGFFSEEMYKCALNKLAKQRTLDFNIDQELIDSIEKGIDPKHLEKFCTKL